jgi:hypothetical protein
MEVGSVVAAVCASADGGEGCVERGQAASNAIAAPRTTATSIRFRMIGLLVIGAR